jgi:hypothetical protein
VRRLEEYEPVTFSFFNNASRGTEHEAMNRENPGNRSVPRAWDIFARFLRYKFGILLPDEENSE